MFYLWANIRGLNAVRALNKRCIIQYRPTSGITGERDRLVSAYMLGDAICAGVDLRKVNTYPSSLLHPHNSTSPPPAINYPSTSGRLHHDLSRLGIQLPWESLSPLDPDSVFLHPCPHFFFL